MADPLSRSLLTRALVAAVVTVAMFTGKALTIAAGRDAFEDPFVNGFFFAGGLALVVAFVLAGAGVAPRHRGRGAALGLVVGIVGGVTIAALAGVLLPADGSWVWGELNLWVIALLTLALVLVLRSRADPA